MSGLLGLDKEPLSLAGPAGAAEPYCPQPPSNSPPGDPDAGRVQPSHPTPPVSDAEDDGEEPPAEWDRPAEPLEKIAEALCLLREVELDDVQWELAQRYGRGASRSAPEDPYTQMRAQITGIRQETKRLRDGTKGWSWHWRQGLHTTGPRPAPITDEDWASASEAAARHLPEENPSVDLSPLFEPDDFAGLLDYEPDDKQGP